jgi:N-glycosylase/DNA lyase
MKKTIEKINQLKKTELKKQIDTRIREFESVLSQKDKDQIFNELCFCILTANFKAEKSIQIQNKLQNEFSTLKENKLAIKLKQLGHRFPNMRAKFIIEARKNKQKLIEILSLNELDARDWLVENIKGLGMKESSHFLRNIGFKNIAIVDFHIIDLLVKENLIQKPKSKSLTKKQYLEIEQVLKQLVIKANLNLAELDLYLWYIETGKVLK